MNELAVYVIGAITTISLSIFGILYGTEHKIIAIWLFFFSCVLILLGVTLAWVSYVTDNHDIQNVIETNFSLKKEKWSKTNGPYGSTVFSISPSVDNENVFYASFNNKTRISKSIDYGKTWKVIDDYDFSDEIRALSIFPDDKRLLAGTKGKLLDVDIHGNSSTEIEYFKNLGNRSVRTIAISSDNPKLIFIGTGEQSGGASSSSGFAVTSNGNIASKNGFVDIKWVNDVNEGDLHMSTDGGLNWVTGKSGTINEAINSIAFSPISGNIAYMATSEGKVYTSKNSGKNWSKSVDLKRTIYRISISYENPAHATISSGSGVYYTTNFSKTWDKSRGIDRETDVTSHSSRNLNVVYAGTHKGLYKSVDGGKSFSKVSNKPFRVLSLAETHGKGVLVGTDVLGIKILAENNNYFIDTFSEGASQLGVASLHTTHDDEILIGTSGGLYRTEDRGSSFTHIGFFDYKPIWSINSKIITADEAETFTLNRPKLVLVGTADGQIYISSDMGNSWTRTYSESNSKPISYILSENESQDIYAVASHGSVVMSSDNGKSWKKISSEELESEGLYSLIYFTGKDNYETVAVGTVSGKVFVRNKSGLWDELSLGTKMKGIETLLYIKESTGWSLFIGTNGSGVYHVNSNGELKDISKGLKSKFVKHLISSKTNSDLIFAATEDGIYRYNEKKSEWNKYSAGLEKNNINQFTVSIEGKHIYAGEFIALYGRTLE